MLSLRTVRNVDIVVPDLFRRDRDKMRSYRQYFDEIPGKMATNLQTIDP